MAEGGVSKLIVCADRRSHTAPHRTAPHLNLAAESANAKSADDNGSSRCHEARWIQRVVGILELPETPDNFLGRRRAHRDRTHRHQPRGICRSCTATTGGSRTSRRCQRRPGFGGGAVSCSRRVVLAPRANGRDGGRASSPIRRIGEIARHSRIGRSSMRRVVAVIDRGHPCATRHPFRLAGLTALESLRKVGLWVGSWTISPAWAWHPSLEITVTASMTNESIRHEELYRRGYHYPAPGPMDQVDAIVCLAEPPLPTYLDPARTLYDRTVPCVWSSPGRVIQSLDASFFCYLWKDIEITNIEEGSALNLWLIGLKI